jgi:hypothetical protein
VPRGNIRKFVLAPELKILFPAQGVLSWRQAHADLLLLFIGIHNAWDAILYHVFNNITSGNG